MMRLARAEIIAWCMALLLFMEAPATSQEYFGTFPEEPKLEVVTVPDARPQFRLLAPFNFDDPNGLMWITPSGAVVDGASIPRLFWRFIGGPMSGKYLHASIIHDHYCQTKERTAHDTHRNFYYGMKAKGVPTWKAKFMYWAVSAFGPSWKLVKPDTFSATEVLVTHKIRIEGLAEEDQKRLGAIAQTMFDRLQESDGSDVPNLACPECAATTVDASLENLDRIGDRLREDFGVYREHCFRKEDGSIECIRY